MLRLEGRLRNVSHFLLRPASTIRLPSITEIEDETFKVQQKILGERYSQLKPWEKMWVVGKDGMPKFLKHIHYVFFVVVVVFKIIYKEMTTEGVCSKNRNFRQKYKNCSKNRIFCQK